MKHGGPHCCHQISVDIRIIFYSVDTHSCCYSLLTLVSDDVSRRRRQSVAVVKASTWHVVESTTGLRRPTTFTSCQYHQRQYIVNSYKTIQNDDLAKRAYSNFDNPYSPQNASDKKSETSEMNKEKNDLIITIILSVYRSQSWNSAVCCDSQRRP